MSGDQSEVRLVDTHAHPMDPALAADEAGVLERARAAGVAAVMCVGYDRPSSQAAVEMAGRAPGLKASVGLHPHEAEHATPADLDAIARLAGLPTVVALGETGLDYYRNLASPEKQRALFDWHLRLAEERHLPVVVHNREADTDVAAALEASAGRRAAREIPGVLHCFSSEDEGYLRRLLDAGYYVSFAGTLTFKKNASGRAMAQRVPLDRLLLETDCPYLAPEPRRGRTNEPAYVRYTAACLAEIRGLSLAALATLLWENSRRIFPALVPDPTGAFA